MRPIPELVAHEEAHAAVARWLGWEVVEIGYGRRGGSGFVRYSVPDGLRDPWRELLVTLAGNVSDVRTFLGHYTTSDPDVARDAEIGSILRAAKRIIRTGFLPKSSTDKWKAAFNLVSMQPIGRESLDGIERDLRAAWSEVSAILDSLAATGAQTGAQGG